MMDFLKFSGEISKKSIITLQALRFKLNCLNQTCISSKSIMQLTKTIFHDSAIFIEEKWVENRLWRKSEFLWRKKIKTSGHGRGEKSARIAAPPPCARVRLHGRPQQSQKPTPGRAGAPLRCASRPSRRRRCRPSRRAGRRLTQGGRTWG
jgi:hypothetical protein